MAALTTIRNIAVDNLPALMVIGRVRSTTEVITVIPGNVGLDELMTQLLHGVELFSSGLAQEIREEVIIILSSLTLNSTRKYLEKSPYLQCLKIGLKD